MSIEYKGTIPKRCLYCGGLMIEGEKHECIIDREWNTNAFNSHISDPNYPIAKKEEGLSFWQAAEQSKEGDVLQNISWTSQNIVNNGDNAFMWEETWTPVKLNGEFLGARWIIKSK
jgi:hypothetical protein